MNTCISVCKYFHKILRMQSSFAPFTLSSSGVIVAHLIPTLYCFMASAASVVTLSSVASRCGSPRSKYLMSRSKKGKINWIETLNVNKFSHQRIANNCGNLGWNVRFLKNRKLRDYVWYQFKMAELVDYRRDFQNLSTIPDIMFLLDKVAVRAKEYCM